MDLDDIRQRWAVATTDVAALLTEVEHLRSLKTPCECAEQEACMHVLRAESAEAEVLRLKALLLKAQTDGEQGDEGGKLCSYLRRGTVVIAVRDLDSKGACVGTGDLGVVFEEAGFHEGDSGPMVRWLILESGQAPLPGGACNIYEGDVRVY